MQSILSNHLKRSTLLLLLLSFALSSTLFIDINIHSLIMFTMTIHIYIQCYHVPIRHVWTSASLQEVCFQHWDMIMIEYIYIPYNTFSFYLWRVSIIALWNHISVCRAYVFFSTPVAKELINHIKCDVSVLPRIGALREVFLIFYAVISMLYLFYRYSNSIIITNWSFFFSNLQMNLEYFPIESQV